jgi:hypothetical protein
VAQIEVIEGEDTINVQAPVGALQHGTSGNVFGDVMAVQALLKWNQQLTVRWSKLTATEPNGILDATTKKMILDYQAFVRRRGGPFWVALDGRVSPSRGDGQLGGKQIFTITQMNGDAEMITAALALPGNHVTEIVKRFPQLRKPLGLEL